MSIERILHQGAPSPRGPTNCGFNHRFRTIPGLIFSGANDGVLRAYSTKDGSIFWEFNTNGEFKTVNGVPANGASMIGPGPVIAGGMLFVNSGYAGYGGRSDNVLLALGLE
jgi:polyvinyl alcohol dehydrogenase (cytochrome)